MSDSTEYRFIIFDDNTDEIARANSDNHICQLREAPNSPRFLPPCMREVILFYRNANRLINIRRIRLLPSARYKIASDGNEIGIIARPMLRVNRYFIEFSDGGNWMFHMPLFSV